MGFNSIRRTGESYAQVYIEIANRKKERYAFRLNAAQENFKL
jgi:hypothetical protein